MNSDFDKDSNLIASSSNVSGNSHTHLNDRDLVQQLEAIAIHWTRQIKGVINSHEHEISSNNGYKVDILKLRNKYKQVSDYFPIILPISICYLIDHQIKSSHEFSTGNCSVI